jgi:hypothetical protein
MPNLTGSNVLIVGDTPGTADLRERLILSGANIQVVSVAGAGIAIRQKKIDSAFVSASMDKETRLLCDKMKRLGIALILMTPMPNAPLRLVVSNHVLPNNFRRRLSAPALT